MIIDLIGGLLNIIFLVIGKTAILWAPMILGYVAFFLWHHYVEEEFLGGIEWQVLQLHIPRENDKTPEAMELVIINAFYHMSQKGPWEIYWQGAIRFFFSFEIASIDGKVFFFVRIPSRLRRLVESQFYAQYPQIKIEHVEDYTLSLPRYYNDGSYYMWGCEFKLKNHDAIPIKTYNDFDAMAKPGTKEEHKVDCITPVIEYLGSLGKGEQLWIQIVFRPSIKTYHTHGTLFHHHDFYTESDNFYMEQMAPYTNIKKRDDGETYTELRMPDFMKDMMAGVNDKGGQIVFDVGIRQICIGDKKYISADQFNVLRRDVRLLWRQYTNVNENEFQRVNSTQFDSTWGDPLGVSVEKMKQKMLTFYKNRAFFYLPLRYSFDLSFIEDFFRIDKPKIFVLSAEELATIFHLPGMVSETPSFKRMESKTAKPPANLPF